MRLISKWFLAIISMVILLFVLLFQAEEQYEILFIGIGFLLEMIFLPCQLIALIIDSTNAKSNVKYPSAFLANMLTMCHSSIFIITNKYNNNIIFQILTIITLIIVVLRICKNIKINRDSSFSILKAMNLFFVAGITAVVFIFKLNHVLILARIENLINFYYILPFLVTQGMYELLDGRK